MSWFRRKKRVEERVEIAKERSPGGLPWDLRTGDLGVEIVDKIGHSMTLDAEWSIRTERGFTWWGKDLAQHVWAEPGINDDGFEIFRLHARTDLLRSFQATPENLAKLNAFAGFATTSGFLVDDRHSRVQFAASMYAHDETDDWVRKSFGLVAAIQAADAQIKAQVLAEFTGAEVDATPHPSSGLRPEHDDMLNVLEDVVVPLGQRSSAWEGEELEWTTEIVQRGQYTVLATGDSTGLSAEFPFQSRTSLLTVTTETSNPQLGNGALLVLRLPMNIGETDGHRFAVALNRRELKLMTRAHYLGCWLWRDDGMCFVTFLPNALRIGRGDLLNQVIAMSGRAKWVAETFYGDDWDAHQDEGGRPLATPAIGDLLARLEEEDIEE
jgi:hypothetical protein